MRIVVHVMIVMLRVPQKQTSPAQTSLDKQAVGTRSSASMKERDAYPTQHSLRHASGTDAQLRVHDRERSEGLP
jgi:hypothetical protein